MAEFVNFIGEASTKNSKKKVVFLEKDKLILQELIKNPRASDKAIAQKTGIPIKTVNRRRKALEQKNAITYHAMVNNYATGTQRFNAINLYIFYFNFGITRDAIYKIISSDRFVANPVTKKHIMIDQVGEKDGRAIYSCFLVSRVQSDMIEILNAEILPIFEQILGQKPIFRIEEIKIYTMNKLLHNYLLNMNIDKGRIIESFPDSNLFVTEL